MIFLINRNSFLKADSEYRMCLYYIKRSECTMIVFKLLYLFEFEFLTSLLNFLGLQIAFNSQSEKLISCNSEWLKCQPNITTAMGKWIWIQELNYALAQRRKRKQQLDVLHILQCTILRFLSNHLQYLANSIWLHINIRNFPIELRRQSEGRLAKIQ